MKRIDDIELRGVPHKRSFVQDADAETPRQSS